MKNSILAKSLVMLVATACFAIIFLRFSDIAGIKQLLLGANLGLLAAGAVVTVVTISLRAVRASLAVSGRVVVELMAASVVHNAMTALLPMKLGELVLPYLLLKLGRAQVAEGLGILLLLRVLDLATLVLVGVLAIVVAFEGSLEHAGTLLVCLSAAAAGTLIVTLACWNRIAEALQSNKVLRRWPIVWRVLSVAVTLDRRRLAWLLSCSMAIWISLFTALYCFAASVYPQITPIQAAAIGAAASMAFAFPISGVANTGPFQTAWLWMSLALGLEQTPSLAASLLAHGSIVVTTTALGLFALVPLYMHLRRRRRALPAGSA